VCEKRGGDALGPGGDIQEMIEKRGSQQRDEAVEIAKQGLWGGSKVTVPRRSHRQIGGLDIGWRKQGQGRISSGGIRCGWI